LNFKKIIRQVSEAAAGKDNFIDGVVGFNGYGFVFKVFKLINRKVPFKVFEELMSLDTEQTNRIWITNLGSLDKLNEFIASEGFIIKMLYGGVSPTYEALFIPVFTIDNKIHFQLHCLSPPNSEEEIEKYVNNSLKQLIIALKD